MKNNNHVMHIILCTAKKKQFLSAAIVLTVAGSVIVSLFPPLVLGYFIDMLTGGKKISVPLALFYFLFIILTGGLDSLREYLLVVFGQRITHALRKEMSEKLNLIKTEKLSKQTPGAIAARFTGDVNTVEKLFTSGIISMITDICRIVTILITIWTKTKGLALMLILILPLIFLFTRAVQKRMRRAQLNNRIALSKVTNHVPETLKCIRTIHTLGKEKFMEDCYDRYLGESYKAVEKTNFYDSVYSPVILIVNAVIVAIVMLLSASGCPVVLEFFGMSVGTAVAVMNYISQVFSPIESIGMEIETLQSAAAGIERINEFLELPERDIGRKNCEEKVGIPCIELRNVSFGYDSRTVIEKFGLCVYPGEKIILAGRTGAGKSTIIKLISGLYEPCCGNVLINGVKASEISDSVRRKTLGYVNQSFNMVKGNIRDQIKVFDPNISDEMVYKATKLVGIHDAICALPYGYDTKCSSELFSQGQFQLISIARAVVANPQILLLDEITANLDAKTETQVLAALETVSANRTVISVSHRIYNKNYGRIIEI